MEKFASSPNKCCQQAAAKETAPVGEDEGSDWDDDPNIDDKETPDSQWKNVKLEGFARNPMFVSTIFRIMYNSQAESADG